MTPPTRPENRTPLSPEQLLDLYFLDARSKLIEIAAFLDRLDRASEPDEEAPDFRLVAFREALAHLGEASSERTQAVQLTLSDRTTEPLESAAGMQGARGAYPGPPA